MVLVLIDPIWQEFVNKQIEDMNRYKMRMFASLSHELRTPLNCSISMLEFLETDILHLANKTPTIFSELQIKPHPQIFSRIHQSELDPASARDECIESVLWPTSRSVLNSNNAQTSPPTSNHKMAETIFFNEQQGKETNKNMKNECDRIIDQYLKPALHSSKLLLNLINDILDFVQIDSGKFKFTFVSFSLENLLHECMVLINLQARSKNIKLEIDFDSMIPDKIESDPNRIRQVLLNFLSNALKFTVQGQITLQARLMLEYPDNNLIQLSVTDSGIGISDKDIQNIFTIFNKVDLGNNQGLNSQGCGLGLTISNSISKGLAPDRIGGVQVESVVGQGSKFSFLIENHATYSPHQEEQSCDIIPSNDNDESRPRMQTENSPSSIKPAIYDQYFDDTKFINSQQLIQGVLASSQKYVNNQMLLSAPSTPYSHNLPSIENIHKPLRSSSFISDGIQSGKDMSQKDSRILESLLNDSSKCSCLQILAADDNEFNLFVIQQILLFAADIHYIFAYFGEQLLERRERNKCCSNFKLIFMDIEMPIMNGYQTSSAIYEFYRDSGILDQRPYVIACTAMVGQDEKELAKRHFMDDYITKPIQNNALESVLNGFVSHSMRSSLRSKE